MTADPYAHLDAGHLLGALDADERLAYEAHGSGPARRCPPPVSQGRWLVSLTQWTVANPWPCHWISLMQAEPRYSR